MNIIRIAIGAIAGGLAGYAMYRWVGCRTGACPLTANPYLAIFIYGLLGVFISAR